MKKYLFPLLLIAMLQIPAMLTAQTPQAPSPYDAEGHTPITKAVTSNKEEDVKKAIASGADINMRNAAGDAPIMLALKNKSDIAFDALLAAKPDLNTTDKSGKTLAVVAVETTQNPILEKLILAKADLNSGAPIAIAVKNNNTIAVTKLIDAQVRLAPAVPAAVELNSPDIMVQLMNHDAPMTPQVYQRAVQKGNQEMLVACIHGKKEVADAILDHCLAVGASKSMMRTCLEQGANGNKMIDYVVKNGDGAWAEELLTATKCDATKMELAAFSAGNLDIARKALAHGASATEAVPQVVASKNTGAVALLLETQGTQQLILESAVANNNTAIAKMAIDKTANASDPALITSAVTNNNASMVKLLLENNASATTSGLVPTAVGHKNEEMVRLLVEAGADPNAGLQPSINNNLTGIAVYLISKEMTLVTDPALVSGAARNENLTILTALITKGALPDPGMLPAIQGKNEPIVKFLIEKGAKVDKDEYISTAVDKDLTGIALILIEKDVPITWKSDKGENLLHIACKRENFDVSKALIGKSISVTEKTKQGDTPLHYAVRGGRDVIELVQLLLDNQADINAQDNKKHTILEDAKSKKLKDYLKSKGAL